MVCMGDGTESDSDVAVEASRPKTAEPPKYACVLHNDDYTTMEFVIEILQKYFHKSAEEAAQIMLRVHHAGSGVAGIYALDIAETKASQVEEDARSRGYPLKCTVESA